MGKRVVHDRPSKNILMKDGTARRVPEDECERLLSKGQAKRYISNTIYKALALGIDVKNFDDRDEGGKLRSKIAAARDKAEAKKHKKKNKEVETESVET
ncbi:MAG: hypothetical protein AB7L09_01045 [Nitrospira sp.]